MSSPEPNITVNVDVTNPGQFFACCGLLELADRLWPGAEGWFDRQAFCLKCEESIASTNYLLSCLLERPEFLPSVTKDSALQGSKLKLLPFTITFPESILQIDWWRDELRPPSKKSQESCASSLFKTWAGNQSPQQIIYDRLVPALRNVIGSEDSEWFFSRVPLSGRFGFDYAAAVKAIDAGWSPDMQEIPVATSPAIELLAMIGLQRWRPVPLKMRWSFSYRTWSVASAPILASIIAKEMFPGSKTQPYQFTMKKRGDYKYFGRATPIGEHS